MIKSITNIVDKKVENLIKNEWRLVKQVKESQSRKKKLNLINSLRKEKISKKNLTLFDKLNLISRKRGAAYARGLSIVKKANAQVDDGIIAAREEASFEGDEQKVQFITGSDLYRLSIKSKDDLPTLTNRSLQKIVTITKTFLENIDYAPRIKNVELEERLKNKRITLTEKNVLTKMYEILKKERLARSQVISKENAEIKYTSLGYTITKEDVKLHELSIFTFINDLTKVKGAPKKEETKLNVILDTYESFNKFDTRYEIELANPENPTKLYDIYKKRLRYEIRFREEAATREENIEIILQKQMLGKFLEKGNLLFSFGYETKLAEVAKRTTMHTPRMSSNHELLSLKKGAFDLFFQKEKNKLLTLLEQIKYVTGIANTVKQQQRILEINNKLLKNYTWYQANKKINEPSNRSNRYKAFFDWFLLALIIGFKEQIHDLLIKLELLSPREPNVYLYLTNKWMSKITDVITGLFISKNINKEVVGAADMLSDHLTYPQLKMLVQNKEEILNMHPYVFRKIKEGWDLIQISTSIKESLIIYYIKKSPVYGEELWDIINQIGVYGIQLFD